MLSSILLKYFKNLTKRERRELSKFVRSPFHNQREEVIRLFDYLDEHFDNPSVWKETINGNTIVIPIFKKEKVYKAIFEQKQDFNDAHIRATMSQLANLIKEYFIHSDLKNNKNYESEKALIFRQALLKRGFKTEYEQYLMEDSDRFQTGQRNDSYHRYVILHERSYWQAKNKRSQNLFYDEMGATLDSGYVVELLRLACSMQSHKTIIKVEYELPLLETVLNLIEKGWFKGQLYVEAFYHAYWVMQYDEVHFNDLDRILIESSDSFHAVDLHFLYKAMINYNTHFVNVGTRDAVHSLWRYFKTGFDKKILIQDNIIVPHDFIIVVSLGLSQKINDVLWVENFIKEYISFLPSNNKENYSQLINGIYHFYLKNYEQSMIALKKVTFEDELHQLRSRRMLAIMYFELQELDVLSAFLDSFKVYLHRQKTMAYQKEGHLAFIRFLEKLTKINLNNEEECASIWAQIKQVEYVAMCEWFKSKLLKEA